MMATLEPSPDGMMLINGQPALRIEVVQEWFKIACNRAPSSDTAAAIAKGLNDCALFEFYWKNTLHFKELRQSNPSRLRMERAGKALLTLKFDLPVILDDSLRATKSKELDPLVRLIEQIETCYPYFEVYLNKKKGREPELWHKIARNLCPLVKDAMTSCGKNRAGFGKDTSPAIKVIQSALAHLGVQTTTTAIVEAIRQRPKKGGKI